MHSQTVTGATLGRLYPDLLMGAREQPAVIVDAKYKILTPSCERRSGVAREDLYQLASYLSTRTRAPLPTGMLAYPHFNEPPRARAELEGPWCSNLGHTVRFARLPATGDECVEALRELSRTRAGGRLLSEMGREADPDS